MKSQIAVLVAKPASMQAARDCQIWSLRQQAFPDARYTKTLAELHMCLGFWERLMWSDVGSCAEFHALRSPVEGAGAAQASQTLLQAAGWRMLAGKWCWS